MASNTPVEAPKARDDAASWATPSAALRVGEMPAGALNLNVAGRRLAGPVQGFGQLWQKTYRVRLGGAVSPADVIREWKSNYASYWPAGNRFYAPVSGLEPGDVAIINATSLGGVQLSTGIRVIYADDESFSFMNAEGHPAAGMITFSAIRDDTGVCAQVQALIRANDPFYDLLLPFYGHRAEDQMWTKTLAALAAHFGAPADVVAERVLVDRRRNWSEAKNVWRNAAIRSGFYMFGAPIRWVRRRTARAKG
ncbi:MAG TPA: DUF1990 family protein [Candidatus Limnocylindria bacterium]|jgi:hypothetical protein|nr:DUF1990 family protein [Candidatus Limnocylindria bacterium]